MGNTFGKRTLTPGYTQAPARAPGAIPGKTTRVQQELGAGRGDAAAGAPGEDVVLPAAHGPSDAARSAADLGGTERALGRHELTGARAHAGGVGAEGTP
jgi:hypothetical protein